MKGVLWVLLLAIAALFGFLITTTAPIDPAPYSPPQPPPLTGALAPNKVLEKAELLALGLINGPEEVAIDDQGRIYAGTQNGKIMRITADGKVEVFAETGGRPLGMQFDKKGNLIVCDSYKGLLSIGPAGNIKILAAGAEGIPFKFTDALDISEDGRIYFTDASYKYGQDEYLYDLLESKPYGRLLSYDPSSEKTVVLLKDLYFANGVALSSKEDFVLVNETYRYRIKRYWLKGPKAGTHDIFMDNLPGFPDNISGNRRGTFWLALFTVRNSVADAMHPYPFLKAQLSKLPKLFWPKPKPYGLVLAINENGAVTQSLHEPSGKHLREITSARQYGDFLYLGSLHNDRIGRYRIKE
jgi:sugar lactone lactonase YvrE